MNTNQKKIRRLKDMKTKEVSLVPQGMNLKIFSIRKEADPMNAKIIKAVLDTKTENETELRKALGEMGLEGDTIDAAVGMFRLRDGFRDSMTDEQFAKAMGLEIEDVDAEKIKADALVAAKAEIEKAAKNDTAEAKAQAEKDALAKASPEVAAKLEALEKQAVEDRAELEKQRKINADEREVRLQKEFVEKAAAFENLGLVSTDFGPVLKSISESCSSEQVKYLTENLARLSAEIKKSALFETIGSGKTAGDTTVEELQKAKKAELRAANPDWTDAQIVKAAFASTKGEWGKRQDERRLRAAGAMSGRT